MRQFRGLTLSNSAGLCWRWIGSTLVHQQGRDLRLERWQTECPQCGATVTLRARLASGLRSKFYARRYNVPPSEVVEVRLPIPAEQSYGAFELRSCSAHGGRRIPEKAELVTEGVKYP